MTSTILRGRWRKGGSRMVGYLLFLAALGLGIFTGWTYRSEFLIEALRRGRA